jgi:hypothetical protein
MDWELNNSGDLVKEDRTSTVHFDNCSDGADHRTGGSRPRTAQN